MRWRRGQGKVARPSSRGAIRSVSRRMRVFPPPHGSGLFCYLFSPFGSHSRCPRISAPAPQRHGGGVSAVDRHLVLDLAGGDPRDHDGAPVGVSWAVFAFRSTGHWQSIMLSGKLGNDLDAIHHYLPHVRASGDRDNARGRLPVLLQLQGLRRTAQAQAGRLLRVLLLWLGGVPADAGRELLRFVTVKLRRYPRATGIGLKWRRR